MANKDICIFVFSLAGGGAEKAAVHLANFFAASDDKVTLLVLSHKGEYEHLVREDVEIASVMKGASWLGLLGKLLFTGVALRKLSPSHLLTIAEWPNTLGPLLAKILLPGTKTILSEQNTHTFINSPSSYGVKKYVMKLARKTYCMADHIVAVSSAVEENLRIYLSHNRPPITVVPNMVDVEGIWEMAVEPCSHPWLLGPGEREIPVLVAMGRFVDQKDYPTMIHALGEVLKQKAVRLLLLGDGELKQPIRQQTEKLGIAEAVEFMGFKENPFKFLSRADVFIHSARYEGFPLVFIEAMACGVPIATTDCISRYEVFGDATFVRVSPIGDSDRLAASILDLLDGKIPKASIKQAAEAFNVNNIASQYAEILD